MIFRIVLVYVVELSLCVVREMHLIANWINISSENIYLHNKIYNELTGLMKRYIRTTHNQVYADKHFFFSDFSLFFHLYIFVYLSRSLFLTLFFSFLLSLHLSIYFWVFFIYWYPTPRPSHLPCGPAELGRTFYHWIQPGQLFLSKESDTIRLSMTTWNSRSQHHHKFRHQEPMPTFYSLFWPEPGTWLRGRQYERCGF